MTNEDKLRAEVQRLKKRIVDLETQIESMQNRFDEVDDDEWGDFAEDEIEKLNKFYKSYTEGIPKITPAIKFRIMDCARLELRKQQLGSLPDPKESKMIQEELSNIYKILGIQNLSAVQEQSAEERFFSNVVAKIEQTEPAVSDTDEYKDANGFEKMQAEILRCLRNDLTGSKEYPELDNIS